MQDNPASLGFDVSVKLYESGNFVCQLTWIKTFFQFFFSGFHDYTHLTKLANLDLDQ